MGWKISRLPHAWQLQLAYLGGPGLQGLLRHLPGVDCVPHVTADPPYYDVAVKCLDNYFEPFRRLTFERHLFHQINQNTGERFTDFVLRLQKQVARCCYDSAVVEELIADRITQGCSSEELRIKLLQKDRTLEDANAIRKSYSRGYSEDHRNICFNPRFKGGSQSRFQRGQPNDKFICYNCGKRGHIQGSNDCPARRTKCASCGRIGHWAKRCYSRGQTIKRGHESSSTFDEPKPKRIRAVVEESEKEQAEYIFYAMGRNVFVFKIGGVQVPMTIDSGAYANIINRDVWNQMKEAGIQVDNMSTVIDWNLVAYASVQPMDITGMFMAEIEAGGNKDVAKFYIVENGQQCLLGDHTAKSLKVLKVGFNVGAVKDQNLKPFPKFRNVVVEIPIDIDVQPV